MYQGLGCLVCWKGNREGREMFTRICMGSMSEHHISPQCAGAVQGILVRVGSPSQPKSDASEQLVRVFFGAKC